MLLIAGGVAAAVTVRLVAASSSSTAPLGLFITLPAIWIGLLALGICATLVLLVCSEAEQPTALAGAIVPLVVAVLALALPEWLKHNRQTASGLALAGASVASIAIGALLGLCIAIAWRAPRLKTTLVAGLASLGAWTLVGAPYAIGKLQLPPRPDCERFQFDEAAWKQRSALTADPDRDG